MVRSDTYIRIGFHVYTYWPVRLYVSAHTTVRSSATTLIKKIIIFIENIPKGPKMLLVFGPFGMFLAKVSIFCPKIIAPIQLDRGDDMCNRNQRKKYFRLNG